MVETGRIPHFNIHVNAIQPLLAEMSELSIGTPLFLLKICPNFESHRACFFGVFFGGGAISGGLYPPRSAAY
jgi:hypothetical protein